MAKKSNKSIYKCGGKFAQGGNLNGDQLNQSAMQGVGSAGPWGALVAGISKVGDGIGQGIGGDAGNVVSGTFSPLKGLGLMNRGDVSGTKKALGLLAPGMANKWLKDAEEKDARAEQSKIQVAQSLQQFQQANKLYALGGKLGDPPYTTKLTPEEQKQFSNWYSKVSKYKQLSSNPDDSEQQYDYRGYWKNEKNRDDILKEGTDAHFIDKYKMPGHPTFSNESMYSNEQTPGGNWTQDSNGKWYFHHSPYTSKNAQSTEQYLRGSGDYSILGNDTIKGPDYFNNQSKLTKTYAKGGSLDQNQNITQYGGLTHEQGGLPIGENAEVEDNETRGIGTTQDYIFSDSLKPDKKSKYTFSDLSKKIEKKYVNMENDRYAVKSKDRELALLMYEQEALKKNNMDKDVAKFAKKYPELFANLGQGQNTSPQQQESPGMEQLEGSNSNPQEEQMEMQSNSQDPNQGIPMMRNGGIYINPSNKGKFNATKDRTGKTTEELTHSSNPITRKRAIFAQNAAKWHHQLGGFIGENKYLNQGGLLLNPMMAFGGELPIGDPKKLSKAEYAAEVAKRKQVYENEYLKNYTGNKTAIDPFQDQAYQQYQQTNPFSNYISDIQLNETSQPTGGAINLEEGFDIEGFDYRDKTWNPTSAAASQYKLLKQQGRDEEADKLVFGYFGKGKGGAYNPSTHGEAVKLGNIKPITYKDLYLVPQLGDDINKTYIPNQLDMMDQVDKATLPQKKYGGLIYDLGGIMNPTDPPTDPPSTTSNGTATDPPDLNTWVPGQEDIDRVLGKPQFNTDEDVIKWNDKYAAMDPTYKRGIPFQDLERPIKKYAQKWNIGAQALINKVKTANPNVDFMADLQQRRKEMVDQNIPYDQITQQLANYAIQTYGDNYVKKADIYSNLRPMDKTYYDKAEEMLRNRGKLRVSPDIDPRNTSRVNSAGANDSDDSDFGWRNLISPQYIQSEETFNQVWKPGDMLHQTIHKTTLPTTNNKYGGNIYGNRRQFDGTQPYPSIIANPNINLPSNNQFGDGLGLTNPTLQSHIVNGITGETDFYNERNNINPYPWSIQGKVNQSIPNQNINPNVSQGSIPMINSLSGNIPQQNRNNVNEIYQNIQSNPNIQDEVELKNFRPDYLAAGLSTLPNIGMGIANFNLANNLNFQRTNAEIMNPDYIDPTRAIQESRNQFAGAKDTIRQSAGGSGALMSNLIGIAGAQSEAQSGIQSKYDEANAGIYNQTEQFNTQSRQRANDMNAQIQMQEALQKTQLKQEGFQNLSNAVNTGINTMYQSKRDADMMNLAGGENFYYKRIGGIGNQTPVKVFQGNGFHYYEDPKTGQRRYLDANSGKQIKDKNQIKKFEKDIDSGSDNSQYADMWKGLSDSERLLAMKYLQNKKTK